MRTYSELITIPTFLERFRYLSLDGVIGDDTFGFDRWMNQVLYHSPEWESVKRSVIIRDNGCDLGVAGYEIHGRILVHHMNPIRKQDILNRTDILLNPEYLISTSFQTHQAIHWGNEKAPNQNTPVVRKPNDTCPWKH